jgi:hypothetical protein
VFRPGVESQYDQKWRKLKMRTVITRTFFIFLVMLCVSCTKKNPTSSSSEENDLITTITQSLTDITINDIVRFECVTTTNSLNHFHWMFLQGNTVYEEGIVATASGTNRFDQGEWVRWNPPQSGTWIIEVLAYSDQADHPTEGGAGGYTVFYEYQGYGRTIHCFRHSEKGTLWDEESLAIEVSDAQ